jgi:CHAT domain-containing protein
MYRILVVDDEADVRSTLSGVLADAGYSVHEAANEGEAMKAILDGSFDFAVIDVRLHGDDEKDESGLSLAFAINRLRPQIRLIMLTRYVITEQIVRAIRYYGVIDFIEKAGDWDQQILETIQKESKKSKPQRLDTTKFSLSLAIGQPIILRTRGMHVCSRRTSKNLQIQMERYARKTELARTDEKNLHFQTKDIGLSLWQDIFVAHPEIKEAYGETCTNQNTLVSLQIEAPVDFLRLPLEFMYQGDQSKCLVLQHPLARFVCGVIPKREPISRQRLALAKNLRVLIIASNTEPPISGVDIETQKLRNFLEKEQRDIFVDVKLISTKQATYGYVRDELKKPNYDIIHYAGHGLYNPDSPEKSSLFFWSKKNKHGDVVPMKATELKMLLEKSEARLVYLSCCYGTATGDPSALLDDDFLGLADSAVNAGIPTVLGFRWPVSDDGACQLALAFYRSLLEQGSPGIALLEARRELAGPNRDDPAWLSPILIHQE